MKEWRLIFIGLFLGLALAPTANAEEGKPLRYAWKKGSQHHYRISIVVDLEDGRTEFVASPVYHVVSNDDGEMKMLFFGELHGNHATARRGNPAAGAAISPFLRQAAGLPLEDGPQLTVNDRGKVVAQETRAELPFLLGELAELPFVLLPKGNERMWTTSRELTLSTPNQSFGAPSFRLEKAVKAEQETNYTIEDAEGPTTTIKIDSQLTALERIKQKPTVQMHTEGTAEFDSSMGAVVSYEAKVDLQMRQKNTTIEIPITIRVNRVDDAEIARLQKEANELMAKTKAKMAADEAERNRPIDDEELKKLVETLKSNDKQKVLNALRRLDGKSPDKPDKRVSKALEPLLTHKDFSIVNAAFTAMKTWATEESVPALLNTLEDNQSVGRIYAIQILEKYPSKRVAEELALLLNEPGGASMAGNALKSMGKLAEEPTLAQLKKTTSKDLSQQFTIVMVLQEVGGAKSLSALKPLAASDSSISSMAKNAIAQIERRLDREKLRRK